jgi:hypothetical protein
MNAPAWARLIGRMNRIGYSLAELGQKQTSKSGLRLTWVANFVSKEGMTPLDWFQAEAPEPFEALSLAAAKILEGHANGFKQKLEDAQVALTAHKADKEELLSAVEDARAFFAGGCSFQAGNLKNIRDRLDAVINKVRA